MEFQVLGSVQVHDERSGVLVVPTGAKQRALLGTLVVRAGHLVPTGLLVDELWGEHPPANAANALQAHVGRLRRLLPGAVPGSGERHHPFLVTRPLGYVLSLGRAETDVRRFRRLAQQGRALAGTDPAGAAEVLRRGLALWRGPALQGSGRGAVCSAEAALLEEMRLTALERLYEAEVRTGRGQEITGELEELTAAHPLRERFYELLMSALHRCGRQAEALGTYDRARRALVHDLGIEPGPALRGCLQTILRQDPWSPPPAPAPSAAHIPAAAPAPGAGAPGTAPAPAPPPAAAAPAGGGHPAAGHPGGDVLGVRALYEELLRLRGHVERLSREQRALAERLDQADGDRMDGDRPDRVDRMARAGRVDGADRVEGVTRVEGARAVGR
ncbi:AfsR/SARP family transcriptional regulator [Streptomyces sp. 11x1]|uniref:AfsR/SARP family transcriptional regulator n=1 Tax=Streptomyces sp. 11x1 TaxID=3038642 RepID=UPI002931C68F|nr:AfsR/SARP family transcriptional regulator [Streptomyces sp. 11x1]WNZ06359.1 AfsR/SARP family transcriptional regulator [Streptomyces sp. 11x1]